MMQHTRKTMWAILAVATLPLLGVGSCLLNAADWYSYHVLDEYFYDAGFVDDFYYEEYYYEDDYDDGYYYDDFYDDWW